MAIPDIRAAVFERADNCPEVPPELQPALVTVMHVTVAQGARPDFYIAHLIAKGREVYLYPVGDDFAKATCERLREQRRPVFVEADHDE